MFAEIKSRAFITIAGPDRAAFLQGLLTNDVAGLMPGSAQATFLLSPQGKILFDLMLVNAGEHFSLECESARRDELIAKFQQYKLRAKIALAADDALSLHAHFGSQAPVPPTATGSINFIDPRLSALGTRVLGPRKLVADAISHSGLKTAPEAHYADYRTSLGVAEGSTELGIEKLFMLEANAEELHGVDFQKGCYVGQELTSRMKRKAELKKRLLPLDVGSKPDIGAPVIAGDEQLGSVIGVRGTIAFALLRLDRLNAARADGTQIFAGPIPATLRVPGYLRNLD